MACLKSEDLAGLLLRLSEAGEPAILWGRQVKPFLGPHFERLLNISLLIEEAPATEWSVCSNCECGQDSRSIEEMAGQFVAVCPLDCGSDKILGADDLRSFRISFSALVREISVNSDLVDEPSILAAYR